jgi:predicted dehydrogenase
MNRIIKYGIWGCGGHAYRGHFVPGKDVPNLKLVALCDPELGSPEAFTGLDATDVTLYRDQAQFLAHPGLDAVVICSPDRFHTAQLDASIEAGKHVLVDKPAAATSADLIQLYATIDKARSRGLVISSCHPRRFNPAYTQVKEALPEAIAAHGPLLRLELDFSYHVPRPSRRELHTGLLADHLGHEFDYLNFLLGAADTDFVRIHDSFDRYEVAGWSDEEVSFLFSGTRRLEHKTYPETIRLRFARGEVVVYTETTTMDALVNDAFTAHLNCPVGESLVSSYFHESDMASDSGEAASAIQWITGKATDYAAAFRAIMWDFAAAISSGGRPYLSPEEIFRNAQVCVELTERKSCRIKQIIE